MKLLYVFGLALFFTGSGFAETTIDSLRRRSASLPFGKEKIKTLDKLCEAITLSRKNLDMALLYADSLAIVGDKIGQPEGKPLGKLYYGIVNRHGAKYRQALGYFKEYIKYFLTTTDSLRIAEGHYQLGVVYQYLGDYLKSLDAYQNGFRIYQGLKMDYFAACTLVGIGTIYKKQRHWKDGLSSFEKSIVLMNKVGDKHGAAMAMSNMADIYVFQKNYKAAEKYYRQVLQTAIEQGREHNIADDYDDLGDLMTFQNRYREALVYYFKALPMRRKLANTMSTSETLRNIGYLYTKTGQYSMANSYLTEASQLARQASANPVLQDVYLYLSEINEKQGNFSNAHKYHKLYASVKDTIMNEDVANQLNELQVRYETSEKDKQIDILAKEKEIQAKEILRQEAIQRLYVVGFVAALLAGALIFYVFRQRLRNQKIIASKNEELKNERFKTELRDLELKALRAQINPHFIFNCMNSINRMILSGENDGASLYLGKLSKLIRLILENSESDEVQLSSELDLMRAYIELEQLRFRDKIIYEIHIGEEIEPEETYIPSMILQPFIENAIWHGLLPREESAPGRIDISVERNGSGLSCTIEDNGVGRERSRQLRENSLNKQKSLGLKITEERLRLIARKASDNLIHFQDLKNDDGRATGTRVIVLLPEFQESA